MVVEITKGSEIGQFATTTARTGIPQGEKLEQTMKNLCSCLGIKKIHWHLSARGAKFYQPEGLHIYQSASNTILQLSELLVKKRNGDNA